MEVTPSTRPSLILVLELISPPLPELISSTVSSAQHFIKISDGEVKEIINQSYYQPLLLSRQGWEWTQRWIQLGRSSPSEVFRVWAGSGQELFPYPV